MTAHALKLIPAQRSSLVIIKGNHEYQQQVSRLSALAWQVAYTALWNGMEFSKAEKENAIDFIASFILQGSPVRSYSEFVQRVLLARQYIHSHPGSYVPFPSQWFNAQNKNGFAGTLRWYQAVEASRAILPKYKQTLKAFPEAVLETSQSDDPKDFHYWRSYFSGQEAQATLNLFLSTLANCRFL